MRLSSHRHLVALSASAVIGFATPAVAQTADGYEYAQPAPAPTVVFRSQEIVQGVPASQTIEPEAAHAPLPPVPPLPPMAHRPPAPIADAPAAAGRYAQSPYAVPYPPQFLGYAMPAGFDRDRWLDDCHDRIRGVDRKDRGGVIGGLLGAIAGGVIGNRAWDSKRTAGTLLGAGIGGLAGVAIGSAIGASGERRHDDDCAFYLDEYLGYPAPQAYPANAYPGYGYGAYGYGGYALVPVLVAVPQRQVIRETVTEEWVDTPVRSRSVAPRRRHRAAPAPTKYIKAN